MKNLILLFCVLITISSCEKGNSYCEQPFIIKSFNFLAESYDPTQIIEVTVLAEADFSADQEKTLYSFSVPSVFKNPKGDEYTTDIVAIPKYEYELKDTTKYPDSVEIEIYTFNDCGRSESLKGFIRFD